MEQPPQFYIISFFQILSSIPPVFVLVLVLVLVPVLDSQPPPDHE